MTRPNRDDADGGDEQDENDDGPSIHIDIGLSVSDLIRELRDRSETRQSRDSLGVRPGGRGGRGRRSAGRRGGRREQPDADYHVEQYRDDDELAVLADLPGVDDDEVTAGIDEDGEEFVLAVGGAVVERVPLPWDRTEVAHTGFNNDVLEIRLRRGD
jgi:HSP20 family molecular chaperone IbpA